MGFPRKGKSHALRTMFRLSIPTKENMCAIDGIVGGLDLTMPYKGSHYRGLVPGLVKLSLNGHRLR